MAYYNKLFWILTSITTFIRLLLIGNIGLTVDEAHYWVYSRFMDLSYYDHPPMIGYIIKLFTDIFGNTEFAVRLPSVIIFIFTSWLVFLTAKKLFDEKTAFISAVLLNILPVFSFLGAVVTIPDSPLSLFWMLSFYIFILIFEEKNSKLWYLFGITTGLALISKYTAILIFPSVLIFLAFSKENKFWLKKKEIYISMIISFICFLPVILWNLQNNWASFGFQLQHGFGKTIPSISPELFFRSIGAQAGYVSPLLFVFFCYCIYFGIKDFYKNKSKNTLFILSFSLPTLLFFNSIATFNEILPHWPAMGYLILTIYAAQLTIKLWNISKFRKFMYCACILAVILNILVPVQAIFKIISIEAFLPAKEAAKSKYGISQAEIIDVTNDVRGWKELSNAINKIYQDFPEDNKPFLFTHKSYLASQIYFCVPDKRVYCLSDKIDAYDLWQRDLSTLNNKDGLFITSNMFTLKNYNNIYPFKKFEEPVEIPVYKNNKLIKKFWITVCRNFDSTKLSDNFTAKTVGQKKSVKEGIINTDYNVFKFINSGLKNKFFDSIISIFTYFDSKGINLSLIIFIIISVFILKKNLPNKKEFWKILILFAATLIISGEANQILKEFFNRARPLTCLGTENVNVFYEKLYHNSFPSGHTEAVFTAAIFMIMFVRKYWYVFLSLACLVGFERMYAGCHFPLDVFAGACIGSAVSFIIVKFYNILWSYKIRKQQVAKKQ